MIDRELSRFDQHNDSSQKARFLQTIERYEESCDAYLRSIIGSLENGTVFSAAYYLKELSKSQIIDELFKIALQEAEKRDDLWWQVRALEELGWATELRVLLQQNRNEIVEQGDGVLRRKLAEADGDRELVVKIQKNIDESTHLMIYKGDEDEDIEEDEQDE